MTALDPRLARSPGITYQELLDTDTHPVPEVLRLESPRFLGDADVPIERYISREYHELEKERLWKRVWQFACREEHIPGPGDYNVYEIADMSFIVVRQPDMSIKAYPNACLHRGRRLKDYDGHCSELRCPFHGFAWALDGSLSDVPARWDFPHVDERADVDFMLPECLDSCSSTPIPTANRSRVSSPTSHRSSRSGTSPIATWRPTSPR